MKVLFDHQIFTSQQFGGVSKYFAEVIRRLPPESWKISAWLSNNEYARHYGLFKMTPFLPGRNFRGKGRVMAELGKPYSLKIMRRGDFDVVHQTNFDPYLFKAIKGKPVVTTYHDTNFVTLKNFYFLLFLLPHEECHMEYLLYLALSPQALKTRINKRIVHVTQK